jgi:hypothetical protein
LSFSQQLIGSEQLRPCSRDASRRLGKWISFEKGDGVVSESETKAGRNPNIAFWMSAAHVRKAFDSASVQLPELARKLVTQTDEPIRERVPALIRRAK